MKRFAMTAAALALSSIGTVAAACTCCCGGNEPVEGNNGSVVVEDLSDIFDIVG